MQLGIKMSNSKNAYSVGFLYGAMTVSPWGRSIEVRESAFEPAAFAKKTLGAQYLSVSRSIGSTKMEWSELGEELVKGNHLSYSSTKPFIRGLVEFSSCHKGTHSSERPHIIIYCTSLVACDIIEVVGVEPNSTQLVEDETKTKKLQWFDNDALDFLGVLYSGFNGFGYSKLLVAFNRWRSQVDGLSNKKDLKFYFKKTREDAVTPFKARVSDSGFDLTLLDLSHKVGDVEMYHTGIKAYPAFGWYFMLTPRSSIIKTGYMLANNCGIIDRSYSGEILVPLVRISNNAPDLVLPQRIVQLVPAPIVDFDFVETDDDIKSNRGEKGFGSSGKN